MNSSENGTGCSDYWDEYIEECIAWEDITDHLWDYLSPEWHEIVFIVLFVVVFICGIIGNSLVCLVIWRHHEMRTVTNVFILNLAIADLLVLLLVLFPSMIQDIFESWLFTAVGCKILKFIQRVSVVVSILTLTVISVERYCAISNPLKFKSTLKRARLIILAVWLLAVLTCSPDIHYYQSFPEPSFPHGVTTLLASCKGQGGIEWFYFYVIAFFVLPFCIMAVCYVKIAKCLWTSGVQELSASERSPCSPVNTQILQRRKIARMLIVVVVCFFACYLPHYFIGILSHIVGTSKMNQDLYYATVTAGHLLIYVNSAANPIIYNFMSERFRNGFLEVCGCCRHLRKRLSSEQIRLQPFRSASHSRDDTRISEI